ncbi:hypothetical protein Glove_97g103 [Diversispora epigaea]|uniref:Uncharacterized protein n=1 Tax=Diversispora epigaea TaxID=1348612 RepID=A0A397J8H9_9GLOM|nr:hypothetical protein Glove_97g103 [Diversispora epigaea]
MSGRFPECNRKYDIWRCKPCTSKHFQSDFNNWTSGNDKIDKLIQDAQLNANNWLEVKVDLEQYIIDGSIREWDIENKQWKRCSEEKVEVALKKLNNFVNFNDVLNEMAIHLKTHNKIASIRFYGITRDPETYKYMMVLDCATDGNLREYLKINFNNINWQIKFGKEYIWCITIYCSRDARVTHKPTFEELKDGLWKYYSDYRDYLDEEENKDSEIGIQIKIAEEFLANQESTNTTTTTPLNYQKHPQAIYTSLLNFSSLLKPKNEENFERELEELTKSIDLCPKVLSGEEEYTKADDGLWKYYSDYRDYLDEEENKDSEIGIQIKIAEEFLANQESTNTTTTTPLNYQKHPQAIYTSLLNFSSLLKPKNEENFERELEELTKSIDLCPSNSDLFIY